MWYTAYISRSGGTVYAIASKAVVLWTCGFESHLRHTMHPSLQKMNKGKLAYVIGLAIGDGNLSNPNGRATRLRISCDSRYPHLIDNIIDALREIFPNNKVNTITRPSNCIDVSVYSNKLESLLGWKANLGPKFKQSVSVPTWILKENYLIKHCLRGLFETDGSIYNDRGYIMVNFVTTIPALAKNVMDMINKINFTANYYEINRKPPYKTRYNIRISKNAELFIKTIQINKS